MHWPLISERVRVGIQCMQKWASDSSHSSFFHLILSLPSPFPHLRIILCAFESFCHGGLSPPAPSPHFSSRHIVRTFHFCLASAGVECSSPRPKLSNFARARARARAGPSVCSSRSDVLRVGNMDLHLNLTMTATGTSRMFGITLHWK